MPTYEYQCLSCERAYELVRKISERDDPFFCTLCNSHVKKLVSATKSIGLKANSASSRIRRSQDSLRPPQSVGINILNASSQNHSSDQRPSATISNCKFVGCGVGISMPEGADVSMEGNEFHDVKKPIEFRDE